ncbi:hypothetical protein [Roseofilum casamattae]|uniref:Uncharacterized protein n=1 Tax=Roseofilum casamattae BLCC-M143 TaxID=3022442 RepID=A0ABT7BRH8_9CYAN|nr:hypothetical protein [Roseofilum casamattae]MDJ1181802.1 hypothetical protein [Roseofilum casamattae BLCC-M143]
MRSPIEIQNLIDRRELRSLTFEHQNKVLRYLRSIPQKEAFDIILEMVKQKSDISLSVAKKVLNQNELIEQLLEYGLQNTDCSYIKLWLHLGIAKLGSRSTIRLVDKLSLNKPRIAEDSLYWLPGMIPKAETKTWKLFEAFKVKTIARNTQAKPL